jgi:small ligand-binding sensory domain FIST
MPGSGGLSRARGLGYDRGVGAQSFSVEARSGDAVRGALEGARAAVGSPTGGLVFVGGPLARQAAEVAELARRVWRGVPLVVAPGAAVLGDAGEHEGASAIAGVLFSGVEAVPLVVPAGADVAPAGAASGATLTSALASARALGSSSVALFVRSEGTRPSAVEAELARSTGPLVFGGGTAGPPAVAVTAEGARIAGPFVGLAMRRGATPLVAVAGAGKLLGAFAPVDEVDGPRVLSIGGRPALDELSRAAAGVAGSPLVLVAIADGDDERPVLRAIRGVDPARRAILVGDGVPRGTRLAFAVRDAAAARSALESAVRTLADGARGSAPRFALVITCAARGQDLHGAPNVEGRIVRQRLGDLAFAGMASSFELAPGSAGAARAHVLGTVVALYRSPS